ncbi:terminase large subunit domain-containing protein [Rheinheimera sp. 4Y26]|uniref:terminase large subunit domain-containing protein n=1 Tax=Rheinheimera sp. 4Y26 TaxID=2977811 RepID=UPI0021B0E976|nr:terminase family protein [Rheinheimera sp. 4Y26]MCT6700910.1 terminase family protein [Rheinheimera sp. 4Y26]
MKLPNAVASVAAAAVLAVTPIAQAVAESVDHHVSQLSQFNPAEVLLGYQKRWVADESPLKIAEKSRRTGITWAEACDAVLCASTRRQDGGCNHFYVGSNKEMAREFIEAAAMWARVFNKAGSEIQEEVFVDGGQEGKEILTFVVHFASGYKIQALSSNPSNLRGMQGNVTIDEAAFHERLAEVLKAALALTMWGSKVRLISTHNGIENLFNQLVQDSRAGKKRYSVHTITLDDACKDGLYQRICQTRKLPWTQEKEDEWKAGLLKDTATEEDALEEYYCVPKAGAGIYLKRTLIERAMVKDRSIPIVRFTAPKDFELKSEVERQRIVSEWLENNVLYLLEQLPKDCRHVFGEDFARKGDLSVFVPLTIRPDLTKRVPFVVEISNGTYEAQRQILMFILERLPRFTASAFDSTGNGGYLAESARLKFGTEMVDCVMLSQAWYREWMPKLKAEFDDGFIEIPRHQDIIDDLCKIQMRNGVPQIEKGSGKGSDGQQRHGDFAVALAMAVRASWMEGGEIDFTSITALTQNKDAPSEMQSAAGCW